jgi:polyisoprenyl-phosphate glycosyltransferase
MMKLDCFVSVVAPVQDGSVIIEPFIRETISILQQNFKNYELVLIDDGSQDDSVEKIRRILNDYSGFRLLRLSRRFGSDVAISAGLESVIGDYVVVMLPDMDPPNLIPSLVQRSMSGSDVVFGVQAGPSRQGWLYRTGSRLFHLYCQRVLRVKFPVNATQLRCLSRRALNAINQIKDSHRYLRLYSAYVGYPQQEFIYSPIDRGDRRPQRKLLEAVNTGVDLIVENSRHPLRVVTWTGVAAATLNLIYLSVIVLIYFFKRDVSPGWTSLSFQSAVQFLLLSLMFTILSEYVGRILERLRDRPFYYLMDEQVSSVMITEEGRFNVVTSSHDARSSCAVER